MKLALIDLDGVIADNKKREKYANDVAEMVTKRTIPYLNEKDLEDLKKKVFYHTDTFYREDLLLKDELVLRAKEDIHIIWQNNWMIKYITSRPDFLQEATHAWMIKHELTVAEVFYKNMDAFQYVRSNLWKMGIAELLIKSLGVTHLLVVDDEQKNRAAILTLAEKTGCNIQAFNSLSAAADYIDSPDEEGNW